MLKTFADLEKLALRLSAVKARLVIVNRGDVSLIDALTDLACVMAEENERLLGLVIRRAELSPSPFVPFAVTESIVTDPGIAEIEAAMVDRNRHVKTELGSYCFACGGEHGQHRIGCKA